MSDLELNEEAAVRALIEVIEQYILDTWPYLPRDKAIAQLPEGLRLEIHPLVYYMFMRNLMQDFALTANPLKRIPVPVKITPEMPRYGWRLVIVTEEVINGGLMPHPGDKTKEP